MSQVHLVRRAVFAAAVALVAAGIGGWLAVGPTTTTRSSPGAHGAVAPTTTAAAPTTTPSPTTPPATTVAPTTSAAPAPGRRQPDLATTGVYADGIATLGVVLVLIGCAAVWIEERSRLTRLVAALTASAVPAGPSRPHRPARRIDRGRRVRRLEQRGGWRRP